jgi:hypothetical protein
MAVSRKGITSPNQIFPELLPERSDPVSRRQANQRAEFFQHGAPQALAEANPSLTVNVAILGLELKQSSKGSLQPDEPSLRILLVEGGSVGNGRWALPGILSDPKESLSETARRLTTQLVGPRPAYIEQLRAFEAAPRLGDSSLIFSCAFLALVDLLGAQDNGPQPEPDQGNKAWFNIRLKPANQQIELKTPGENHLVPVAPDLRPNGRTPSSRLLAMDSPLAFDHSQMILEALTALRESAISSDKIFNLMPETFSLSCLQTVFETILGSRLLAPAFRRKIAPKLTPTDFFLRDKKFRPSRLFRYNPEWFKKTEQALPLS